MRYSDINIDVIVQRIGFFFHTYSCNLKANLNYLCDVL